MKRARLQLRVCRLPSHLLGRVPPLVLGVVKDALVVGEAEMDRIGIEAGRVNLLIATVPTALIALLVRLVGSAREGGVVFETAAVLERFFRYTAAMEPATAAALSDTEIAEIWERGKCDEPVISARCNKPSCP